MMTWLHEQHLYEKFVAIYCNIDLNKADINTNAHGEKYFRRKTYLW